MYLNICKGGLEIMTERESEKWFIAIKKWKEKKEERMSLILIFFSLDFCEISLCSVNVLNC